MVPRCLWMGEGITFPALNPAEKTASNFMRWRTCNDLRESTSDENRCCSLANQRGKLNRESETIRNCMNYMPGHRSGWWCRNCYRPSGSALPTHGTKQLHHCFGQPQFVQTVGMIPQACHFNPKNLEQPLDQPLSCPPFRKPLWFWPVSHQWYTAEVEVPAGWRPPSAGYLGVVPPPTSWSFVNPPQESSPGVDWSGADTS